MEEVAQGEGGAQVSADADVRKNGTALDAITDHFKRNRLPYTVAILLMIVLNIWLRSGLLQFQGFFEPDAFFYYTAIKQAIANSFIVTKMVNLSGYPWHNGFNEAPGLPYFVLVPYFFLRFVGVSAYTVERDVPILFGVLIAAASYLLIRRMTKSDVLGLLAFFFVSVSSGNIARTAGTVYRGDTFISLFAILALLFMLLCIETNDERKKYAYALLTAIMIGIGPVIWNGGVFDFAVCIAAAGMVWIYGFLASDAKVMRGLLVVLAAFFVAFLMNNLFVYAGLANQNVMQGKYFVVLFVPLLAATLAGAFALESSATKAVSSRFSTRLAFLLVIGLVILGVVYALFGSTLIGAITDQNSLYQPGNITATTQELQKPTFTFLEASFGIQLGLAPLGVLLFLFFGHKTGETKRLRSGPLSLNANIGFVSILGYLILTTYLQASAIRYNALISVPLALLSAYAIYFIGKVIYDAGYGIRLGETTTLRFIYVYMGIITVLFLFQIQLTWAQSSTSVQADGINPGFLQAMTWLSNNTASNATILALWPDGSVVEGWGDRTSFEDSVGGENTSRTINFANFLGNTSPDTQFLYNFAHRPDYILVRDFWFAELGGLLAEGNSTELQNLSLYGYSPLTPYQATGNSTNQVYTFTNAQYRSEMVVQVNATTGGQRFAAFLGAANRTTIFPIMHILFVNSTSGNYNIVNSNYTSALNYTLMVDFTGTNISGSTLLAPNLPESNLFKILVECAQSECAYNNQNVTLTLVFENSDSKIFKINYLNS